MDDALSDNPDCRGCQIRDERNAELRAIVQKQSAQIQAATERIEALEGKVAKLKPGWTRIRQTPANLPPRY